ncbi:MAG: reverse transcriptase family protein, partial [Desulfobacteraceae bacterium]|nr:reverse transcriptase family protein [Desulfobacteraceae bacterium]
NNVYTKDIDLLEIAANFYDNLYSSKGIMDVDITNYLSGITVDQKLTNSQRNSIEGKISYNEGTKAIKLLKANKSPGIDGIPSEFYIKFWEKICHIIIDSFNESFDEGQLSESQRTAIISLIFKKGDAQSLCNYRPISLTNCDYKILAFCLANRIQSVIKSIVKPSQVAYIKGRFIGSNIRLIEDIIEYYNRYDKSGLLMTLDFQKAFDSIEWNFMFEVLKYFNFGNMFISWIKTLYNGPIAFIKNNGHKSRHINIYRGIRQGCPVSALIFIIATEVLAIKMRENEKLKGILIPGSEKSIKIVQYADDAVVFMNNEDEMKNAIDAVVNFGLLSGTQLNIAKCEGLWIGSQKNRQDNCKLYDIRWPTNPIRCLGIYIGHDTDQKYLLNWTDKVNEIRTLLETWKHRNLTLFGKITVLKQLALPKIIFSATMLHTPDEVIKEVNTLFYGFVWGKKDLIKRNVLINDVENGGLKMVDLESSLASIKAAWAVRLMNAKADELWPVVAKQIYKICENDNFIFKLNFIDANKFKYINNIPLFYRQVITSFNKAKGVDNDLFCNTILDQPLWGNRYISCNNAQGVNMTLLFKGWNECGLVKVGNLKFVNGTVDDEFIFHTVRRKANIIAEISMIKKALKPYKHLIGDHEPQNNRDIPLFHGKKQKIYNFICTRSKYFYTCMVGLKCCKPIEKKVFWTNVLGNDDIDVNMMYTSKIINIKDKKIAEFNYKVLHTILPCNVNL